VQNVEKRVFKKPGNPLIGSQEISESPQTIREKRENRLEELPHSWDRVTTTMEKKEP